MLTRTRWNRKESRRDPRHQLQGPPLQDQGKRPRQGLLDMTSSSFYEEGSRLLTPGAFEFVLDSELKRAVRSQNFLTLVDRRNQPRVGRHDGHGRRRHRATRWRRSSAAKCATPTCSGTPTRARSRWCCSTPTSSTRRGSSIALVSRIENYEFPTPLRISVGAACYPTHAVDADSLKRQALSRPVVNWRGGRPFHPDQN